MRRIVFAALLASAALAHGQQAASAPPAPVAPSAAKKELIAKVVTLQQPAIDAIARDIAVQPALQLGQAAGEALQNAPADKRQAIAKTIDAEIRKYVDDAVPLLRERASKVAPGAVGPILDAKFGEDELKQLAAWLESPLAKKYQSLGGEFQQAIGSKLSAEAGPLLTPKLEALEKKVRAALGPPAAATPPKKAASK